MPTKAKPKLYRVLKPVRNDKTGKYFAPGDIVKAKDFTAKTIAGWLVSDPPVLKEA
jgi:hypothetical protein